MIHIPNVALPAVIAGALFNQVVGVVIYSGFSETWLAAMKKDKNRDAWTENSSNLNMLLLQELFLNFSKAWVTGLFLNLTQARTASQALQLGMFLFGGVVVPTVTSEILWENRSMDLQRFKYISGFSSTVLLAYVMFSIGTA
ncbi:hypothetical protein BG011_008090 [Mortierella polycephala]|uniref:Uncharacterized protein n=1 Tax=Mortierella polycephala TaxID=41804 RepID=A0A9P6Q9Q4_9FUNG|nr:hypothetical protein BG011_008090 [Mortierella polycephala]